MNSLPRVALAAAIVLIVQGCSNMQWSKAGADPATVSRDLDQCRSQALGGATPPVFTARSAEGSPDGRPAPMRPSAGSNERFVEEHEVVSACMLRRGYDLRPAG